MHRAIWLSLFLANLAIAQPALFRVVDLDVGRTERVQLANGASATVKLVSTSETRDKVRSAIREARVEVEINSARATIVCGDYRLPVAVGGVPWFRPTWANAPTLFCARYACSAAFVRT